VTQPKIYDIDHITYKKLTDADLPLLHIWLNTPHVLEWYKVFGDDEPTFQRVTDKYLPRVRGSDPVICYFVLYDKKPAAYIQSCTSRDFLSAKTILINNADTAAIDTFIGDLNFLHQGFGSIYILKFLSEIVFSEQGIRTCIIDPDPANKIAIRAYEKAGFSYTHTVRNPKDGKSAYIMTIERELVCPPPVVAL
jgi:RimJ/RimL family protein N-acetyltransferase